MFFAFIFDYLLIISLKIHKQGYISWLLCQYLFSFSIMFKLIFWKCFENNMKLLLSSNRIITLMSIYWMLFWCSFCVAGFRLDENETLRKKVSCKICGQKCNALILPCGHHEYCMTCVNNYKRCPTCNRKINEIVKTYRSQNEQNQMAVNKYCSQDYEK
jgi:hypothetical protein